MHSAGCVRQWFHTAEPLGERRYENWNTHIHTRVAGCLLCAVVSITLVLVVLYYFCHFSCKIIYVMKDKSNKGVQSHI